MSTLLLRSIRFGSTDDGLGKRSVIHLAGCSIRCPGCINPELWSQEGAHENDVGTIVEILSLHGNKKVTIMGGEPFDQIDGLSELCCLLKIRGFHVVLYTGHQLDYPTTLTNGKIVVSLAQMLCKDEKVLTILDHCDVLVDGPYLAHLRTDHLVYRGSSNQRVIDLPKTLSAGSLHNPVLLDWDNTLLITPGGTIVGQPDVMADAGLGGLVSSDRHCGQY